MRYACEIIGEYLPESLRAKLFENLGLPFVQEKVNKRKSELESSADPSANAKKLKVSDVNNGTSDIVQPTEDYGTSNPSSLNIVVS